MVCLSNLIPLIMVWSFLPTHANLAAIRGPRGKSSAENVQSESMEGTNESDAAFLEEDALCYAKRYPDLFSGFCQNDELKCRWTDLFEHYQNHGKPKYMIWKCQNRLTKPATPLKSSISFFDRLKVAYNKYAEDANSIITTNNLHFLLFETDRPEIMLFQQSRDLGIATSIIGHGVTFDGYSTKWGYVHAFLQDLPPDDLVVVCDARDIFLNIRDFLSTSEGENEGTDDAVVINEKQSDNQWAIENFIHSFRVLTKDNPNAVVFSAEAQCCVAAMLHVKPGDYFDPTTGRRNKRACNSGADDCLWPGDALKLPWESFQEELAFERTATHVPDVYLNAGLVTGRAEDLMNLIEVADLNPTEDDQAVFTDLMYSFPDMIVLDYAQELFGTARWSLGMTPEGCPFEVDGEGSGISIGTGTGTGTGTGPLVHRETKTSPLFLHFPGKFWECHDETARKLDLLSPTDNDATDKSDILQEQHRSLQAVNYGPPLANENETNAILLDANTTLLDVIEPLTCLVEDAICVDPSKGIEVFGNFSNIETNVSIGDGDSEGEGFFFDVSFDPPIQELVGLALVRDDNSTSVSENASTSTSFQIFGIQIFSIDDALVANSIVVRQEEQQGPLVPTAIATTTNVTRVIVNGGGPIFGIGNDRGFNVSDFCVCA